MIHFVRTVDTPAEVKIEAWDNQMRLGEARAVRRQLPYGQTTAERVYAELMQLYVNEASRRNEVGTLLVNEVWGWARSRDYTHVCVEASAVDKDVDSFYRKVGFTARSTVYDVAL